MNKVLKKLEVSGAVEIFPMRFRVIDASRIIFDWAAKRNLQRDISEKYFVNLDDARRRQMFLKTNVGKSQLKDSLKKTLASKTYMPYRMYK